MTPRVGTLVKLRVPLLQNDAGTVGVCYETYNLGEPGAGSFIFLNGEYDGFSPDEQEQFLEEIGFCQEVADYHFTGVIPLGRDYRDDYFEPAFVQAIKHVDQSKD